MAKYAKNVLKNKTNIIISNKIQQLLLYEPNFMLPIPDTNLQGTIIQ